MDEVDFVGRGYKGHFELGLGPRDLPRVCCRTNNTSASVLGALPRIGALIATGEQLLVP